MPCRCALTVAVNSARPGACARRLHSRCGKIAAPKFLGTCGLRQHHLHAVRQRTTVRFGQATGRSGARAGRDELTVRGGAELAGMVMGFVVVHAHDCHLRFSIGTAKHNCADSPGPDISALPPAPAQA